MQDIEQNLHVIEDDMLRINVVLLMDKFRKANQQLKDDQSWNRQNDTNQNKDLLESLQNWMDEDHFDDFDDLEPGSNHSITNSNAINDHLDHIQANIQKVESLNEKIKQLKQYGTDTAHLERQRKNLQWQVKQDVLDNDYKRRHGGEADSSNKQEFNYLKNAASEIYNLLNRTRVEGMAHSHQFEEELKKILQQMEDKEKDVEYLESRLEQQKRLVRQWYKDYEKLQNDHELTKDEVTRERKDNRKLQSKVDGLKKNLEEMEEHKFGTLAKIEQEKATKEHDEHMQSMKQKFEVLSYTLKEKDGILEDQHRQITQLKSALRKGSSAQQSLESLYKPVSDTLQAVSSKRDVVLSATNMSRSDSIRSLNSFSVDEETESLRLQVVALQEENRKLRSSSKMSLKQDGKKSKTFSNKAVKTNNKGVQTNPFKVLAAPTPNPSPEMMDESIQVYQVSEGFTFTPGEEQKNLNAIAQQMAQQFGQEWTEVAMAITHLQREDINELNNTLLCESDFITAPTGFPSEKLLNIPDEEQQYRMTHEEQRQNETYEKEQHMNINEKKQPQNKADKKKQHIKADKKKQMQTDKEQRLTETEKEQQLMTTDNEIEKTGSSTTSLQSSPEKEDQLMESDEEQKVNEWKESREDLMSIKVSNSVLQLAEGMLCGQDPELLEGKNVGGINAMHNELDGMLNNVSGFVNKVQGFIGCQTGMMKEVNEAIKKNLPASIVRKLEKIKLKSGTMSQLSLLCTELYPEWKDMNVTEQVHYKLKLIEETLRGTLSETMNVFIGEVAKQHAEYSDIHATIKSKSDIRVERLVKNPASVRRDIQSKVESSVRHMAKVTKAERRNYRPRFTTHRQGMSQRLTEGDGTRSAGGWSSLLGPRTARAFNSMANGGASEDFSFNLSSKQLIGATKKKPILENNTDPYKQTTKDFHLMRLKGKKVYGETERPRNPDMVIKNSKSQKEFLHILPTMAVGNSMNMKKINSKPAYTTNLPQVTSYQPNQEPSERRSKVSLFNKTGPTSKQHPYKKPGSGLGITMFDLQKQLTQKLPKQPFVQRSIFNQSYSTQNETNIEDDLKLTISHVLPPVGTQVGSHFREKDLQLPNIA
ncbi:unnamed protein product [Clavelina lepadiformis]|uniref:Uncharacterized protein n=1 Tax=Clavelina lepadiformis TaxID=159417 RepID=A0ABP0FG67_CLALP